MQKIDELERIARAPMTASKPEFLAEAFSAPGEDTSIEAFASRLPAKALALDIAAGASSFGLAVAKQRDDIEWVNIDPQYKIGAKLKPLKDRAVKMGIKNVHYEPGDIVNSIPGSIQEADMVFIYSFLKLVLLIRQNGRVLGNQAVRNMLDLTKPSGKLMIGPIENHEPGATYLKNAIVLNGNDEKYGKKFDATIDALIMPYLKSRFMLAMNASGVSYFPAGRLEMPARYEHLSGQPTLFDHNDESFYPLLSWHTLPLVSRLALGAFQSKKFAVPKLSESSLDASD